LAERSPGRHRARPERGAAVRYALAAVVLFLGLIATAGLGAFAMPIPASAIIAPTLVYDRHGQLLGALAANNRIPVSYGQLPRDLQDAIVATEDKTFWTNIGIDPASLARAAYADVLHRGIVQGGSTMTQELAKTLFLTEQRTFSRKFAEVFLALRLTATFSKRDIMTMYMNSVYFGEGAYGVGDAARVYFGVPVRRLSLPQAALLAGLVNAPSAYDPYLHPALALSRRNWVLHRMAAVGDITAAAAQSASQAPLGLTGQANAAPVAPYAFAAAFEELQTKDPALAQDISLGGYKVYTTIDLHDQLSADKAVADAMPPVSSTWEGAPEPEGALVSLDPRTGGILALVGGRNAQTAPFDRAVDAFRQVGSTFKPILYATLLGTPGYSAASIMDDRSVSFVGVDGQRYTPKNAGGEVAGPLPVRRALAISDNVIAIKWADIVGPQAIIKTAQAMGITAALPQNLTLALGSAALSPVELAQAYQAFADGGVWHDAHIVARVVGPSGNVVYRSDAKAHRAFSPQIAYVMTKLMEAVFNAGGTGYGLADNLDFPVAGKTGTTNDLYDGWFVGYSSRMVTSVWVGNDQEGEPISGQGAATAGPVWAEYMGLAENQNPPPDFTRPTGVVRSLMSPLDGELPNSTEPAYYEWFLRGTEPKQVSPIQYTGPWTLWPKNPGTWYFAYHGPQGKNPLWVKLMNFPGSSPGAGAAGP